jgi:t-SNARE complex subunit (syntaxin)
VVCRKLENTLTKATFPCYFIVIIIIIVVVVVVVFQGLGLLACFGSEFIF